MRRWSTRDWAPRFRFRRLGVAAPTSSSDPVRRARADRFVGGHGGYDLLIFDLVIPTLGRHSLVTLLDTLGSCDGPRPARILVVDDRRDRTVPLELGPTVEVLEGPGKGPAAARNVGWRAGSEPWVVFLDDDVVPTATWLTDLAEDLATAPLDVVAVQGRVTVPLPSDRRPTDWERSVTGLETARWITADMAVRRGALVNVDGFDERFSRAYREDADLALRLQAGSERLSVGRRRVLHPIPPAPWWVSLRLQAGHRDDVLMSALHGRDWRGQGAPPGRRRRHLATTASGLAGLTGAAFRRPVLARAGLAGWLAGTAELTCARVARGPRTPAEVAAMVGTSLLLPPLATWHWLAGLLGRRRLLARPGPQAPVDEAARA
jgi:hypothetical protein